MALSKEKGDRDFESFVETAKGETARRISGGVHLTTADGVAIDTELDNRVRKILVSDIQNKEYMVEMVDLLKKINEKLSIVIDLEIL